MNKIKLVVFDIAGTTIKGQHNVQRILQETVMPYVGIVQQETMQQVMGWPKPKALQFLLAGGQTGSNDYDAVFIEKIHQIFVDNMMAFFNKAGNLQEMEGATQVFETLHKYGIKVGLDTGFSRPIADVILHNLAWTKLIDATVTSDEVTRGRPAADMIYNLMERLGVSEVPNVAKVGDAKADIEQGRNAGCGMVVGVTSGSSSEEEMRSYKPDYVLPSIKELPELLNRVMVC